MVGNVLKVVVSEGEVVRAEDPIIIMESMKMEIPVLTEEGGVVAKVAVAEGEVVQADDLIAVIE
jgi:biotin carboxyl carrier protein